MRLRKSASFTKWDARPLSDEQIDYAREDVLHLLQVTDALQKRLGDRDRLGWAREECRALEAVSDERDVDNVFSRLPRVNGARRQGPRRRPRARRLARGHRAQRGSPGIDDPQRRGARRDRAATPRRLRRRLSQIRGVSEPTLRRRGAGLLDAVARGREQPPIPPDGQRPPPPDAQDAPLIALGEALVRTRAMEAQLAYELIAARADLERIIRAQRDGLPEPETRTLQGWRRELVGEELLELLAGRRSLRVGESRAIDIQTVP